MSRGNHYSLIQHQMLQFRWNPRRFEYQWGWRRVKAFCDPDKWAKLLLPVLRTMSTLEQRLGLREYGCDIAAGRTTCSVTAQTLPTAGRTSALFYTISRRVALEGHARRRRHMAPCGESSHVLDRCQQNGRVSANLVLVSHYVAGHSVAQTVSLSK